MEEEQKTPANGTESGIDYKALYEAEQQKNAKLSNDNANLSKYNNDLKSKYQAKLSDEEKTAQAMAEREQKYKELELKVRTSEIRNSIGKTILDENLANEVSSLFANGDTESGIAKINEYIANERVNNEKKLKEANLVNNQTPPPQQGGGNDITKAQFNKMSISEKIQLKNSNYELYSKLAK